MEHTGAGGQENQDKCQEYTKAKGPGKTEDKLMHMDACPRMDEYQKHGKEPDIKEYILYDSIYMKVEKRQLYNN